MVGPISFWGYKEQKSNLILPKHDNDDDDDDDDVYSSFAAFYPPFCTSHSFTSFLYFASKIVNYNKISHSF